MRCPYCLTLDCRVVDSRAVDEGRTIKRRRGCSKCGRRFTTFETVEQLPLMVLKHDGNQEVFDRNKLLNGLIRSCDKRNIPTERIIALTDEVEKELRNTMEREITTKEIGELVMKKLKNFDEVAYIRFASVYRKFTDISSFKEELEELEAKKINSDSIG